VEDGRLQSHGDSANSPPPHWHWPLAVRLAFVKLILVTFLMFWKPRYESLSAARRASRPPSTAAGEEKVTLKDDGARQSGPAGRLPRRNRHRRRLVYSLMTVSAVSTLIVLLAVIVTMMTWHPGGWPQH